MPLNAVFDPFNDNPSLSPPNTNPAVLVDKMIGTAYDVVKHVCLYMEQVRHVSAHMEQVYRVSGDLENLALISEQLVNLEIIATNIEELLALAAPQAAMDARLDVLETNYVSRADTDQTINGDKRFSGYTALGPTGSTPLFPAMQVRLIELTAPATDATTTVNANLTAAECAQVISLVPTLRTSAGNVYLGNHEFMSAWLVPNGAGTDLSVSLATGHPVGWNLSNVTVAIILKAP